MLSSIPILAVAVFTYNLLAFIGSENIFEAIFLRIEVTSGDEWVIRVRDLFEVVSLILLFVEVVRAATNSRSAAIVNHILSITLFTIALLEFLMLPDFANSTFFLLLVMLLLDLIASFVISMVTNRRASRAAEH